MKIKSPYLTLIVGLVIAVITVILSVRAHSDNGTYNGAATVAWMVAR